MRVETIRATPRPEQLVCQAARGDYFDGFVGDVSYDELMAGVDYDDHHEEAVREIFDVESIAGDHDRIDHEGDEAVIDPNGGVIASDRNPSYPAVETVYRTYALLDRLFRRGHWGPAEHAYITLGMKGVSRVTMAQLTRHRHVTFDVQSMRYVDFGAKDDPFVTPKSLVDDEHATRETGLVELEGVDEDWALEDYEDKANELMDWYERMVGHGLPKEDARFLLPLGTTVNMTATMNARTLLHIEDMRGKADSQWSIQELTNQVHEEFENWMPMTAHLYDKHGPHKIAP
jgi:thymidylate synthase (FAD)